MSSSSSRCVCCLYSGLAVLMRGHWQQYVFVSPNFIAWRFDSPKVSPARFRPPLEALSSESMFDCTNINATHLDIIDGHARRNFVPTALLQSHICCRLILRNGLLGYMRRNESVIHNTANVIKDLLHRVQPRSMPMDRKLQLCLHGCVPGISSKIARGMYENGGSRQLHLVTRTTAN
jgi:hypothetical protein